MAIVIQQEKKINSVGIFYFLMWMVFILIIISGIYYVFFKKPELYEKAIFVPETEYNNFLVKKPNIDTSLLLQKIQKLESYVAIPQNINTGKENPFF